jgi:hypothetical protein
MAMHDKVTFANRDAEAAHEAFMSYADEGPLPANTEAIVMHGVDRGIWTKGRDSWQTTFRRFEAGLRGVFFLDPQGRTVSMYHGVMLDADDSVKAAPEAAKGA